MSRLDYEPSQPLYLGIDFGYRNPFACLWLQPIERGERVLVLDEYYQRLRTTAENGRAILVQNIAMGYGPITSAYADPANPEAAAAGCPSPVVEHKWVAEVEKDIIKAIGSGGKEAVELAKSISKQ